MHHEIWWPVVGCFYFGSKRSTTQEECFNTRRHNINEMNENRELKVAKLKPSLVDFWSENSSVSVAITLRQRQVWAGLSTRHHLIVQSQEEWRHKCGQWEGWIRRHWGSVEPFLFVIPRHTCMLLRNHQPLTSTSFLGNCEWMMGD